MQLFKLFTFSSKNLVSLCLTIIENMNIFRATRAENVQCENQAKFVQERILASEEKLASLCSAFGNYTQKNCRLRDAGDNISSTVHDFAVDETINKTLKLSLIKFAELMAIIGDLRENNIINIEEGVIKQFLEYNVLCRNAKAEVRGIFGVKEHELTRRRYLGKLRQKDPNNRKIIMKAETELSKAAAESSQVQRELEEHIEIFERKKLLDLKTILKEFVIAELKFHGEALEVYTEAYKTIMKINIEDDFQAFRQILKRSSSPSRLEIVKKNMEARTSLNSSAQLSINSGNNITLPKFTPETVVNNSQQESEDEESVEEESYEEYTSDETSDETNTKISCTLPIKS